MNLSSLAVRQDGADTGFGAAKAVVQLDSRAGGSVRNRTMMHRGVVACVLALSAKHVIAQSGRDSAGVRIVSYARQDKPRERWTLDPKPVFEIGNESEGPRSFVEIRGIVRLSDGSIAVANGRPGEIRLFDAAGQFVRSLGRQGAGPGEFNRTLWALLRSADTLIGIDNTGRAHFFRANGDLVRSLPRARPPGTGGNPQRIAFDARGGAIVYAAEVAEKDGARDAPVVMRVTRESPDAKVYVELLRLPWYRPIAVRGPAPKFEVFGAGVKIAASPTRLCIGHTSGFAVTCYSPSAHPVVSTRRVVEPRPISDADRALFRESYLAGNKGAAPNVIAMIEESNRLTQFARRAPAFGRLIVAPSGELWVSEFDPSEHVIGPPHFRRPRAPLRWSVLAADGTWLSDVSTPARFLPFEMGADYVVGTTLGVDDVELVTLYRLHRSP